LEVKGGTVYAQYTALSVTCQHSIRDFFSENREEYCPITHSKIAVPHLTIPEEDLKAIEARFE